MPQVPRKKEKDSVTMERSVPRVVSTADLARYLKISQWTVSRAINGHQDISEETRQRVLKSMKDLGFQPNPFARGLRGRSMGMVGVCFTRLNIPILDMKVFGLQEFLSKKNYRCLIETTFANAENEKKIFENFRRLHLDGSVVFQSNLSSDEFQDYTKGMAVISIDPAIPHKAPSVSLDRYRAMQMIMHHLLDLNHRSFAMLGITRSNSWRWPAIVDTVKEYGLNPEKIFHCYDQPASGESSLDAGRRMAQDVLKLKDRPTAFVCLDDLIAVGAVEAVRSAGLSVPKDISVTGFNYQDIAWVLSPKLTTIDQQPSMLIKAAGEMLEEQIGLPVEKRGEAIFRKIEPRFVTGESTGPAPVKKEA